MVFEGGCTKNPCRPDPHLANVDCHLAYGDIVIVLSECRYCPQFPITACICYSLKSEIEAKQLISEQLSQAKQNLVETEQILSSEKQANENLQSEINRLAKRVDELENNQHNNTRGNRCFILHLSFRLCPK